jgi:hypothetical protein
VFQAYLTTFLIEPGYEEPIRTLEEMLKSEKKVRLKKSYKKILFLNTSDAIDSTMFRDAVHCPNEPTCFIWKAVYHNISTILNELNMKIFRVLGDWTDDNNRPLLCDVEGGVVGTEVLTMKFKMGAPFLNL